MATPFADIYNRAIFRFADHKFLEQDIATREAVLQKFLISAKTDFQRICKFDLDDYDLDNEEFAADLGDEELEILSIGVAYYWVSYKSLDSELLKNVLNSKDYYYYSPANLLKEVQSLKDTLYNEYNAKMRRYSYNDNDIDTWKA